MAAMSFAQAMIAKGQPAVTGVHVTTALGNDAKRRKATNFKAIMDELHAGGGTIQAAPALKGVWSLPMTVTKADAERQMIFGFASVVTKNGRRVIDKQGDIIPLPELENAAYDFVLYSREGDDMHERPKTSRLIESMVFTAEKCALLKIDLPKDEAGNTVEGWFVGFKVDDAPLWAACKRGERPEFSIGGVASPVMVEA